MVINTGAVSTHKGNEREECKVCSRHWRLSLTHTAC